MRILHIDSGREMRGGQWQVLYLIEGLRERGHEVRLLSRGALLKAGFRERAWPDIVHVHDARSHTFAALLCGRPLVVSRRVVFPIRRGVLSRFKYRAADHYIAISQCVAAELLNAGIKSEAISVVHDGVPLGPETSCSERLYIVAPATTDPMKGSDLVREAARIAGIDVLFSGDLARDLPHASIMVYVTRSEGLGSGALLAMAHGVPVIASRVGGLCEVVVEGETGLLVDNQPAAIARAMRSLVGDPELRCRMGRAGRERVKRAFSVDRMVEETIRVYDRVRQ